MKAYVPNYNLICPTNLNQALNILSEKKVKLFAGGTDLMVLFETGKLTEGEYLSLHAISELKGISENNNEILIGSLTTYNEIKESLIIQNNFPLLISAAKVTGAIAIQNRGTIGGNIANASPAADTPPALLCYEAKITVKNKKEERKIDLSKFYLDYKKLDLAPNEIITCIHLPKKKIEGNEYSFYHKVGTREGQAISKVCFSLRVIIKNKIINYFKLGLGSVSPTTILAIQTEKLMAGEMLTKVLIKKAQNEILKDISPIDDIRSSAKYRKKITQNLIGHYLELILKENSYK